MTAALPLHLSISQRLESFATPRIAAAATWGTDAEAFVREAAACLEGGKRLRGRFVAAGWRAATDAQEESDGIVAAASALEIFQAAALAHDDIIDHSDTRRGKPSLHKRLEQQHKDAGWVGDAAAYGQSGAILVGDLLLAWSDELFHEACTHFGNTRDLALVEYRRMRSDVMIGQFLDVVEESAWSTAPVEEHADRALRVATLKSARYSVQQPLTIGALLGGADADTLDALNTFGQSIGIAFQLRDDLLGVFGDAALTGKPAGDDLREGKRTVLIALTREHVSAPDRERLDSLLGHRMAQDADIAWMQRLINDSGAPDRTEAIIAEKLSHAQAALEAASISDHARDLLSSLANAAVTRRA